MTVINLTGAILGRRLLGGGAVAPHPAPQEIPIFGLTKGELNPAGGSRIGRRQKFSTLSCRANEIVELRRPPLRKAIECSVTMAWADGSRETTASPNLVQLPVIPTHQKCGSDTSQLEIMDLSKFLRLAGFCGGLA
ncbi:hypothetical protein, variant 2 [Blastomyces gilchristii SLH14081]|uniref:Uncharacterized protein n=1 Tax=Blastomyces gilchristii (strain SLH14081) TaxID=559298 RepID=A0A179UU82_BLAGS|nr:uncharacterized protein BDBG_17541 [Blastomyces gilchristii SLH14081]XP_031579945.1 hypothetical protein, variant 1 [Blastomyces gilchristii SLH14081]XP_031579946.1 hypothetical protein, variant 2 [Blastomyces gilchristii SLH14081]OAT11593.1 hypothetical protein BDBG_17541 [Blastomyces gilchristii SLH14081]OAT11594.1 hypothetical protein, variant 1 [Blastomyces gilchristii SLH14081]OAT11595.1 hypothetical protein, variant 2 [Blastomyces gilchristii SLH14081]